MTDTLKSLWVIFFHRADVSKFKMLLSFQIGIANVVSSEGQSNDGAIVRPSTFNLEDAPFQPKINERAQGHWG